MADEGLLSRLDREMYFIGRDAFRRDVDGRGIPRRRNATQGMDIYGHPSAIMHFRRALDPMPGAMFTDLAPPKGPRGTVGKYRDCWVIADSSQPEGALFVRLNGNVMATVLVSESPTPGETEA